MMNFFQWSIKSPLKINKYGIPEAISTKKVNPGILLVPLVAFDNQLNRLGYGGGFYDRFIQKIEKQNNCVKIGLSLSCKKINKVNQGSPHIVDVLNAKKIALVINTGGGNSEAQLSDAVALRRATLANKVPYCTNMSTAKVCLEGIKSLKLRDISVTSLQDI